MFKKENIIDPNDHQRYLRNVIVFVAYLITSILLTWPLIFNLDSTLLGGSGDTYGSTWGIWADIKGLRNSSFGNLIAAPFGQNNQVLIRQPFSEGILTCFGMVADEVTAINIFILLSFLLTAYATYLLLNYLLKNSLSSFVGGLIFGFCPGAVMQVAGGHFAYAFNAFCSLFVLALFYYRDHRTVLSSFYVGLTYALIVSTTLYFGYFALFIALFFVIFDYLTLREITIRRFVSGYALAALFGIIIIVPFQYRTILHQLTSTGTNLVTAGRIRDFSDLIAFSARPLDYFLPSIDHPVLGRFVINISRGHLHGSNLFEQTLYLGVIPLLLCLAGLFLWSNKREDSLQRRYFPFFVIGALWMYFLSMPPHISFWNIELPMVSYFMYKIAPMFRVYARFGILVNFFIACAAAVVLSELSQRLSKMRYYLLVSILLPVLVFEYWSIPPHYARSIDPPPAVYQWLSKEPGDFIVAEYPMMKSDEASYYTYLFWQRIHKKRIVNGATPENTKAWKFFEKVRDLTDPETPTLLKSAGVKYVIVHQSMYRDGQIPGPLKRYYPPQVSNSTYNMSETFTDAVLGTPLKSFGQDIVFAL